MGVSQQIAVATHRPDQPDARGDPMRANDRAEPRSPAAVDTPSRAPIDLAPDGATTVQQAALSNC
jgi:hypothetical protein